ncbi:enoyl-CoA hydratase/isomerase family protein [Actinomadura spongiicola]|uniref:Enoyl-CoA hydratase/isomerase family protein n=1 Tax=Actinomadura spongiicola TaxID=2303421 RepID=A0A372GQF0_9ACTN|nr:enoyl-CoA hydratase/isomerase family protein [Actinomadura spongiicola]
MHVETDRGVAWVTIDHPPINLLDEELIGGIEAAAAALRDDPSIRVVVLSSADPDFFIAHVDASRIQAEPAGRWARAGGGLGRFHRMTEQFRTMPKATIGVLEGRARGGGAELLAALDMRFGARETAVIAQTEVATGIIPGGGGTVRLPRLLGRGRALEVILGCEDLDADLAERYGFLNRALPQDQLVGFVRRLAMRIASFPAESIAQAKAAVRAAEELPLVEALIEEERLFHESLATPAARHRLSRFLAAGGQTREFELDLPGRLVALPEASDPLGRSHDHV